MWSTDAGLDPSLAYWGHEFLGRAFASISHLVSDDVLTASYLKLCRDVGHDITALDADGSPVSRSIRALTDPWDLSNDAHGSPARWLSIRLSLVELIIESSGEPAIVDTVNRLATELRLPFGMVNNRFIITLIE